jgi:hypothetical protein
VAACSNKSAAVIIDPIALAAVVLLTAIMAFGVKESFYFNAATVAVSLVAIFLCIFLGELQQLCKVEVVVTATAMHSPTGYAGPAIHLLCSVGSCCAFAQSLLVEQTCYTMCPPLLCCSAVERRASFSCPAVCRS